MKKIAVVVLFAFAVIMLISCQPPSPLYGTWSDNLGNRMTFANDGTYSAMIKPKGQEVKSFSGNYTVIENVISFSTEEGSLVTEWDLRGSILYLQWVVDSGGADETIYLVLYRN